MSPWDTVTASFSIRERGQGSERRETEFQNLLTLVPLLNNLVPNQAKVLISFVCDEVPITIIMSMEITKDKNSTFVSRWVTPKAINHQLRETNNSKLILNRRKSRQLAAGKTSQPEIGMYIYNVIFFLYFYAFIRIKNTTDVRQSKMWGAKGGGFNVSVSERFIKGKINLKFCKLHNDILW